MKAMLDFLTASMNRNSRRACRQLLERLGLQALSGFCSFKYNTLHFLSKFGRKARSGAKTLDEVLEQVPNL